MLILKYSSRIEFAGITSIGRQGGYQFIHPCPNVSRKPVKASVITSESCISAMHTCTLDAALPQGPKVNICVHIDAMMVTNFFHDVPSKPSLDQNRQDKRIFGSNKDGRAEKDLILYDHEHPN